MGGPHLIADVEGEVPLALGGVITTFIIISVSDPYNFDTDPDPKH